MKHSFDTGLRSTTENNILKKNHPNKGKFGKYSHLAKKVDQYTKDGIFIKTWDSMVDVKKVLGISQSHLGNVCRGKLKTAGGFIWKFK